MTVYVGIFEAWSGTEGKTKTVGNVFLIVLGEKRLFTQSRGCQWRSGTLFQGII